MFILGVMRSAHDKRQKEADFLMIILFFFYNELLMADNYSKKHYFPATDKFIFKIFLVSSIMLLFNLTLQKIFRIFDYAL